jgi:hypothetical protein
MEGDNLGSNIRWDVQMCQGGSVFGLLILSRKKRIPVAELARMELDSFVKGHADETTDPREDAQTSDCPQKFEKASLRGILIGRKIADFCSIHFEEI